uniref:Uncharacterized protein n=1 Tax=Salarias fasciatus TaxID=181472 RepID=A0A672HSG8_SALFA
LQNCLKQVKWLKLRNKLTRSRSSASRTPFVLFGKHSSSDDLQSYSFSFPSESHRVRGTGPAGSAAAHMILQCVTPRGPLACSRTYFFGTTHTPYLGELLCFSSRLLSQIYSAAVQGVLSGIKCYSCTTSASKAKDVAENTFLLALERMDLKQYRGALRSKCEFSIQAAPDAARRPHTHALLSRQASLVVHDVPDLRGSGALGSVVFSESFLESSINILQRDGAVSSDSCYTVLTASVPRYACWPMEADVKQSEQAQQLAKVDDTCLGTVLTAADAAYMFSSSQLSTPEEGKMVFFSEGLLFVHSQYGSITLSRRHISSVRFYEQDAGAVASLFVEYDASLLPHLPFPLHSSDQCLLFGLQPRSRSLRAFYSKVSPSPKPRVHGSPDYYRLTVFCGSPRTVTKLSDAATLPPPPPHLCIPLSPACSGAAVLWTVMSRSVSSLPSRFLQHFALSSIGQEPILFDHLGALFPSAELKRDPPAGGDKVVVSIVSGLPGSHRDNLHRFLLQTRAPEGNRGCCCCRPGENPSAAPRTPGWLSASRCPARRYTDVLDVVQAVLFHPDPVLQACFTIGAVTACVNPLSACMEKAIASLLKSSLCVCVCSVSGVVSAVVFTGLTADEKHPLMQHVQQLVRSANPTAAFVLAEKGAVTRWAEDVSLILSESSFSEPQMLRARYVLYPGWCRGRFSSGGGPPLLAQRRLAFSRPLERNLFVARCKALQASLRPSPFRGNLYNVWGKVRFSDSDRLVEVSYNAVSGALTAVPDRCPAHARASCSLTFDGVGLTEDGLKDWLRLCATQPPPKKSRKTEQTLSPQEVQAVHESRHLEPLPPGFFYNGQQYVDVFGEKRSFHPNMEAFVREYVSDANREIERFNAGLELQDQPDLFDP